MIISTVRKLLYDHGDHPVFELEAGALKGLRHRTIIDRQTGASELALWQEEHLPDFCVPPHRHDCEEIITVLDGAIHASIGEERYTVAAGQSILIPAWIDHGFTVCSNQPVRLLAIFSSGNPRIFKIDGSESIPPWEGGCSDHLEI